MRRSFLLVFIGITWVAGSSAQSGTYVPVPPVPGSVSTTVFAINDRNVIAGSYRDASGIEHGFFGTFDGKYTSFDYGKGTHGTEARGIAVDGSISGIAPADGFAVGIEFFRKPNGSIKPFTLHKHLLDGVVQGINGFDTTVGDYIDSEGVTRGYYGVAGTYHNDFNLQIRGWIQNSPRGISEDNAVAGFYIDKHGAQHGFVQQDRQAEVIDYPDPRATATALDDINRAGQAPGQWNDKEGNPHAFVLDMNTGTFTVLDPGDGSDYQQAWSVNGRGLVSLSTSQGQSYIYCPAAAKKCPQGAIAKVDVQVHLPPAKFLLRLPSADTDEKQPLRISPPKRGLLQ